MSADLRPQGSRLVWCLRTFGWVVVACVLICAAIPLITGSAAPTYQAEALVVARQLTVNERVLPRLAEAVFTSDAMTDRLATEPAIGGHAEDLIPGRLSVVAAEDSIVLLIQGRDRDPVTAARLATVGASALASELNRGGSGVGEFAMGPEAVVPTEPLTAVSPQRWAAIGALAGLGLGMGLVALIALVRRPVVTAFDVEHVVGVPLLGTVHLPLRRRPIYSGPLGVRGIAPVTRWLAALPSGRLLLLSSPSITAIRQRVLVPLAVALTAVRPVRLEAPQELVEAARQYVPLDLVAGTAAGPEPGDLVLVDGGSPFEIVDPVTTRTSVVIVALRGISRRHLYELAAEYEDGGLVGVVLVDARLGPRRVAAHRAAPGPTVSRWIRQAGAVAETERA